MKIETLPGLLAAHEGNPGHILILDMNDYDRGMESFHQTFLHECKLIVEIDKGANLGWVRKSRSVHASNLMAVDEAPAVFLG